MRAISNQSLLDIAIQYSGDESALLDWALKNNLSITADLQPGYELTQPASLNGNIDRVKYFNGKGKRFATALRAEQLAVIIPAEGIGAMIIEDSFIVF